LEIDPLYVTGIYLRGTIYEKLGKIDDAINDFSEVLRLDPNHVNAAFSRAACLNYKVFILEKIFFQIFYHRVISLEP
jgi:hypothetical protein